MAVCPVCGKEMKIVQHRDGKVYFRCLPCHVWEVKKEYDKS